MYLDSAIIVKLLTREEDSAWFDRNVAGHELWTSELALAEVPSAVLIKERAGLVSIAKRRVAFDRFDQLRKTEAIRFLPLTGAVVEQGANLLKTCHPEVALRSLDSIHLATALLHPRGPLCTTNGKLRAAAKRIGLPCFPENLSDIQKD